MTTQSGRLGHVCTCEICQRHPYSSTAEHHRAINRVLGTLDEKNRRRFVGLLALQWGRGGVQRLIEITGLSRNTIGRGAEELQHPGRAPSTDRIRQAGAGRKRVEKKRRGS
ncbi:MAG TPA: hypothetical protein VLG46_16570 [Anaerolineae bacterium]|nr:hypothetical protein [Anaerolineae bacterium]